MSVTFQYSGATYNLGRLSDELIAGAIALLTIRGDTTAIDVVCSDGQVQAPVDTIVAAHSGATPPPHDYPALPGGTTTFVRADGTLAAPVSQAFPVGSVFISVVSTDPATLLGYGTWEAIAAGRVLVGLDSGDSDFNTAEETGGAKTHTHANGTLAVADHASHTHTYTQVIDHVHVQNAPTSASGGAILYALDTNASGSTSAGISTANPTGSVGATGTTAGPSETLSHSVSGSLAAGSSVQPYFVVYMWKRTA